MCALYRYRSLKSIQPIFRPAASVRCTHNNSCEPTPNPMHFHDSWSDFKRSLHAAGILARLNFSSIITQSNGQDACRRNLAQLLLKWSDWNVGPYYRQLPRQRIFITITYHSGCCLTYRLQFSSYTRLRQNNVIIRSAMCTDWSRELANCRLVLTSGV